ncbi:MAG: hypothetical protein QXR69_02235 [Conexivisphaerales archaeon]
MDKAKVQAQLKGNTLRVYVYCLKNRKVGVREVQRALHFSNPSLAQYHLNKLVDLGLLKENSGEYEIATDVKVDIMRDFLRVGTLLVPRFIFYAVFFSIIAVYLVVQTLDTHILNEIILLAVALVCASAGIFWYEALVAWLSAPSA